jgi:aprataxin
MEVQIEESGKNQTSPESIEADKAKQIVVLLIGPPGSGKSTFCDTAMRSSHRPWSRICQVSLFYRLFYIAHKLTDEILQRD